MTEVSIQRTITRRAFQPDYVSAETLAYRLDCSRSTIDDYVRRGLLPHPQVIGNLKRWRWSNIEEWIAARGPFAHFADAEESAPENEDPYLAGVKRATTSET
jgi:predicted DNA-binding transcriptional regulator AlpA